jgi:hypothetical protein
MRLAYTRAAMPAPSRSSDRAEARRRARLAARGEDYLLDETDEVEREEEAPRQSFLQRLVPPAPPLRGRGDPLAGFDFEGPMRPVVEALYLLRRNPIAWLGPGLIWLAAAQLPADGGPLSLICSIAQYVVLIAAGWFGWQRPWLYGVAAALSAWVVISGILIVRFGTNPASLVGSGQPAPSMGQLLVFLGSQTLIQLGIGFVAGWYGGYLRRRLGDQRPAQALARGRRR